MEQAQRSSLPVIPRIPRVPLPSPAERAQAAVLTDLSLIDERFEVVRCLGEGGMARVYEVRCRQLHRRLALKVIRPGVPHLEQVVARLRREAELLRRLDHPNCVQLIEWNRTRGGGLYLLMELADGTPLSSRLGSPMAVVRALEVARQVLLALQHAHGGGIIHRDVKPENVMLLATARRLPLVKLLDFGLAKQLPTGPLARGVTRRQRVLTAGFVVGSPTYLAPEVLLGEEASVSSDLYSVGVMLLSLLTGRKPFGGTNVWGVLQNKLDQPTPRLDLVAPGTFAPELERAVARAMARDPQRRFESAAAFLQAITCIQRGPGRGLALAASPASSTLPLRRVGRTLSASWRRLCSVLP